MEKYSLKGQKKLYAVILSILYKLEKIPCYSVDVVW